MLPFRLCSPSTRRILNHKIPNFNFKRFSSLLALSRFQPGNSIAKNLKASRRVSPERILSPSIFVPAQHQSLIYAIARNLLHGKTLLCQEKQAENFIGERTDPRKRLIASPIDPPDADDEKDDVHVDSVEDIDSVWSALFRLCWPDRWLLLAVIGTAFAAALLSLRTPRVMGSLINVIAQSLTNGQGSAASLGLVAIYAPARRLLSLFMAQGFLTFTYIYLVTILGERLSRRLRQDLFHSLLRQDIAFFDGQRTGNLIGLFTTEISEFKHAFKQTLSQGVKCGTHLIGAMIQLSIISPKLTGILLLVMPIMYAVGNVYGAFLRKISNHSKKTDTESISIVSEALSNIRTVKAFVGEAMEDQVYEKALLKSGEAENRLGFHIGIFQGLTNISIGGMIVVVLYFGGGMVSDGSITGGDLMSYLLNVQQMQKSIASMSVLVAQSIKATSALSRIVLLTDRQPDIPPPTIFRHHLNNRATNAPEIRFTNVDFAYASRPEKKVLQDFSLTIPAGRVVALCGASGAGKSTVAQLLERFYDPNNGSVSIDGTDIQFLDPGVLRSQIGYIGQEPVLFNTTIIENIRYGCDKISDAEVVQASKFANAHDFICSFPDQYFTEVGERGLSLSGGQKQRVAIARALVHQPRILILDEATSALDTESEKIVQRAIDDLIRGDDGKSRNQTVIIIAHRLSTIERADWIVVMEKGKIVEQGTHSDLLDKRGAYFRLHQQGQS